MQTNEKTKPYILWLGTVLDHDSLLQRKGVSPAANRWQEGLITALGGLGLHLRQLGHVPEPAWPRGSLWLRNQDARPPDGFEGNIISYLNLPFGRKQQLIWRYISAFKILCKTIGPPTGIISYNPYDYNAAVGQYAQQHLKIPWICIVADAPGVGPAQERLEAVVKQASGRIFLAWGSYKACQDIPKLHLDGGIQRLRYDMGEPLSVEGHDKPSIILYTGAMSKYGGVDFLAEAFTQVKNPHARLVICGPGTNERIMDLAQSDSRIEVLGLVPESQLQKLSHEAKIFINPRPSSIPDNQKNFPSKILEYLSYGKPVISTWTEGLHPAYQQSLVVLSKETADCLAEEIENVLQWTSEDISAWQKQIERFMRPGKLWSTQAQNLYDWLTEYFPGMADSLS